MLTTISPLSRLVDFPGPCPGSPLTACAPASRTGFGEGPLFSKELAMSLPDPGYRERLVETGSKKP